MPSPPDLRAAAAALHQVAEALPIDTPAEWPPTYRLQYMKRLVTLRNLEERLTALHAKAPRPPAP